MEFYRLGRGFMGPHEVWMGWKSFLCHAGRGRNEAGQNHAGQGRRPNPLAAPHPIAISKQKPFTTPEVLVNDVNTPGEMNSSVIGTSEWKVKTPWNLLNLPWHYLHFPWKNQIISLSLSLHFQLQSLDVALTTSLTARHVTPQNPLYSLLLPYTLKFEFSPLNYSFNYNRTIAI